MWWNRQYETDALRQIFVRCFWSWCTHTLGGWLSQMGRQPSMLARIEGGPPKACIREARPCKGSVNTVCVCIIYVDFVNSKARRSDRCIWCVARRVVKTHSWWLALANWEATTGTSQYWGGVTKGLYWRGTALQRYRSGMFVFSQIVMKSSIRNRRAQTNLCEVFLNLMYTHSGWLALVDGIAAIHAGPYWGGVTKGLY